MATEETDEPLTETTAGVVGDHTAEAFANIGNETRLTILLALWEAYDPQGDDEPVPFTDLRKRVGVRDSGQFHYHLDKLTGEFVAATDDGYSLTNAGHKIVRAIIAGIGLEDPAFEVRPENCQCPACGSPTLWEYDDRQIVVHCPECEPESEASAPRERAPTTDDDHGRVFFRASFDPAGVINRPPEDVLIAHKLDAMRRQELMQAGVCPECSGVVQSSFVVCDSHEADRPCSHCGRRYEIELQSECTVCKKSMHVPADVAVQAHPKFQAAFVDLGYSFGLAADDDLEFAELMTLGEQYESEASLVSEDPRRVAVTATFGDRRFRAVFDENVDIVEFEEKCGGSG